MDSAALLPPLVVRVPGSTSNLGPGFDLLGLALSLHLEVRLELRDETRDEGLAGDVRSEHTAFPPLDGGPDLLLQAFEAGARALGVPGSYSITSRSEIPVGRGLGSSGAAVAAGLLLARALATGEDASVDELLGLGVELEGHPDNVTASLLGGCTLCHPSPGSGPDPGRPLWFHAPLHPDLVFAVAWPAAGLSTREARAALPRRVSFDDAVENPRRLALLLEGLRTADPRLLRAGSEDRLHVPHRLPSIPGGAAALEAARGAGAWLATISGAGSGLVALGPGKEASSIASAMAGELERASGSAESRVVTPVHGAPEVRRE